MIPLVRMLLLSLTCGGSESAFIVEKHAGGRNRPSSLRQRQLAPSLFSANTDYATDRKEMALRLLEENAMPPINDVENGLSSDAITQSFSNYDEDLRSPLQVEFSDLMAEFVRYSQQDIQSLTTASTRYIHHRRHLQESPNMEHLKRLERTQEEGIRYRSLYSGVKAASLEPDVLRSFTVLFEDYLPIRLAGRRIYGHLKNVMEEVNEQRLGEIEIVREACPEWSMDADRGEEDVIECARRLWDTIMDEAMLRESFLDIETYPEVGIITFSQAIELGIGQVLVQEGIVANLNELQYAVRRVALREKMEIDSYYNIESESPDEQSVQEDTEYLDISFPIWMKVLYQLLQKTEHRNVGHLRILLRKIEEKLSESNGGTSDDACAILATKAINGGNSKSCKKRQAFSNRYDGYLSKFKLWEQQFLEADSGETDTRRARRLSILRGCFAGARNRKVVTALKIVYMDYTALRLAGDLIFKLMSKITT